MKQVLFYAMRGDKMCFIHTLLNALDLAGKGHTARIVFEGQAVLLPKQLADEANPLYRKALDMGLIAGVCRACARQLGALEAVEQLGLPLLEDMSGHAGMRPFAEQGYDIVVM